MKIRKNKCDQCLFSNNKIVSDSRAKKIIIDCIKKQTHFMCHKADDVSCSGFNKALGGYSQSIRIAERLKCIEYVE